MSFIDQIGNLLNQYATGGGATNQQEAHEHYDQIANAVPPDVLGSAIGPAIASLGGENAQERILDSANAMNPQQRGGFVQSLLNGFLQSGVSLTPMLEKLGINPTIAQNPEEARPEDVARLAAHAHENHIDVFHQAMSFYAQHPMLVKVLGSVAIAAIAKKLGQDNRTRSAGAA